MSQNEGTILYVGGFELPDKNAAAHRVLNNAKIFRELGYNVVFCGVNSEIFSPVERPENIMGFESFPIPYPSNSKQWIKQMLTIGQYSHLIHIFSDIKFVICYNLHSIPLAKLISLCRKKSIKIVADCTEWYENKFSINPIKFIKCIDTFLCMRVFQKRCDGMIAISSYLANYYKKSIKNIIIVPPLVDLSNPTYIRHHDKKKTMSLVSLIYSGSPSASKESLGLVVECLNRMNDLDFEFKIVGITQDQFKKLYGNMDFSKRIIFFGRVSHECALNAVRMSDYSIIIRPKTRANMAGFPTKFVEAVSVSTPVITNGTSDLAHYMENGQNGYLVDLENFGQDLREILTCKSKPNVTTEVFDYRNWIQQFDSFIKSLE